MPFPMALLGLLCLIWQTVSGQPPTPAIRIRLNRGVFDQASSIAAGLVEYQISRIQMPSTQQCFTEGCVQIQNLRMINFRQPQMVYFGPNPPNQLALRLTNFDFYITGTLGGSIQVIIQFPVGGTIYVTGRGLSVTTIFDLQKSIDDEPYLRMIQCGIEGGVIEARVAGMGIFTDTVNQKYGSMMSMQTRRNLQNTMCRHMQSIMDQHFSDRLRRLPTSVSIKDLVRLIISGTREDNPELAAPFDAQDLQKFFNVERMRHLFVDVNMLDASATPEDFSIGLAGNVFSTRTLSETPYIPPFPFRLPHNNNRRQAEVIVSEYTVNSLLYQAHRTNALLFHVDSTTPGIGPLLKTTCTMDEICISDQIEEVGLRYPGKNLELIVRTISEPIIEIADGAVTTTISAKTMFFVQGSRRKVGTIPFTAVFETRATTVSGRLKGSLQIKRLVFHREVDFFGLTPRDLEGFRQSIRQTLEKKANATLRKGIPLSTNTDSLPIKFNAIQVSFMRGVLLLQSNIDLYNTLFGLMGNDGGNPRFTNQFNVN